MSYLIWVYMYFHFWKRANDELPHLGLHVFSFLALMGLKTASLRLIMIKDSPSRKKILFPL